MGAGRSGLSDNASPLRILVVDDDPTQINVIKKILRGRGYKVISTTKPTEAGRILEAEKIDLVTLDLAMPDKDGLDVYRDLEAARDVPVLFVTGCPERITADSPAVADLWRHQFSLGRTDILYKPFDEDTLIEKVEGLIGPAGQ